MPQLDMMRDGGFAFFGDEVLSSCGLGHGGQVRRCNSNEKVFCYLDRFSGFLVA